MEDFLTVGVITSTHGVRGEVKVYPTTDDPKRFKKCKELVLDTGKEKKTLKVEGVKFFKQFVIIKLEGINTMVSELGGSLSGGQRQRLSIARALVKNPEILILDDSLSAVDALTESNIIRELREQRSDKTNIIVAHRFSAIKESDKIIVLQDGKITDIGTHKELLSYDNWYKEQYLKQINNDQLNRGRRHHDA